MPWHLYTNGAKHWSSSHNIFYTCFPWNTHTERTDNNVRCAFYNFWNAVFKCGCIKNVTTYFWAKYTIFFLPVKQTRRWCDDGLCIVFALRWRLNYINLINHLAFFWILFLYVYKGNRILRIIVNRKGMLVCVWLCTIEKSIQ